MIIKSILSLLIGYAFGLFQTGYIYGKMKGIDIRKTGSGNAGTTNALRTMGKKAGLIVMIGDILKCVLAVGLIWLLFGRFNPEADYMLRMITGFGAIIGHNYPFYMDFKGGKGVACTSGLIISISPVMVAIGLVLFFGTVAITHYVSLASLLLGIMFMTGTVIMGQIGAFHTSGVYLAVIYAVAAIITAEMFYRHRENILRLMNGTERKTFIFKKNKEEVS